MTHLGGLLGMGYGQAPSHLSRVPKPVIQFDSTFAFLIAGDHGLVGGLSLLLVYVVPFALVLAGTRQGFSTGQGLACVLSAAFLNEALLHAGMNLGVLPFTGRNLPLLSATSLTDLVRWTIVLCLAAQAVTWQGRPLAYRHRPTTSTNWFWPRALAPAALSVVLIGLVATSHLRITRDQRHAEPFSWNALLAEVQGFIDRGYLVWDASRRQISTEQMPFERRGLSLVEQEVARFNSLPDAEQREMPPALTEALMGASSRPAYDALMQELRERALRENRRRPRCSSSERTVVWTARTSRRRSWRC